MSGEISTFMIPLGRTRKRNEKRVHPVQPLAQALELVDRYRRAQVVNHLQPGMLCVEKTGLALFNDSPVLIFWRMLNCDDWLDRAIIEDHIHNQRMINRIDCIVARLSDDSVFISYSPHFTELLEPYELTPQESTAKPAAPRRRKSGDK